MPAASNERDPLTVATLRPMTGADMPFLYEVYAGTRAEELSQVPWSDEEIQAFLDMQFRAQHAHYQKTFPEAAYQIIEQAGEPIGRLYLDRRPDEIRIIDIALLPEWRGGGIGGALMRQILDEAALAGRPVRIHVERNNPAMSLYGRLGFRKVENRGVYWLMEWLPGQAAAPAT